MIYKSTPGPYYDLKIINHLKVKSGNGHIFDLM